MKSFIRTIFHAGPSGACASFGLLLLRLGVGGLMMAGHGWGKLSGYSSMVEKFHDPIGLGSQTSLILVVFAEFFCAGAVILGLLTRLAAIPLVINMLVAAFVFHVDDPFAKQEFALLYAIPFLTLVFTGAGRCSIDGAFNRG